MFLYRNKKTASGHPPRAIWMFFAKTTEDKRIILPSMTKITAAATEQKISE